MNNNIILLFRSSLLVNLKCQSRHINKSIHLTTALEAAAISIRAGIDEDVFEAKEIAMEIVSIIVGSKEIKENSGDCVEVSVVVTRVWWLGTTAHVHSFRATFLPVCGKDFLCRVIKGYLSRPHSSCHLTRTSLYI